MRDAAWWNQTLLHKAVTPISLRVSHRFPRCLQCVQSPSTGLFTQLMYTSWGRGRFSTVVLYIIRVNWVTRGSEMPKIDWNFLLKPLIVGESVPMTCEWIHGDRMHLTTISPAFAPRESSRLWTNNSRGNNTQYQTDNQNTKNADTRSGGENTSAWACLSAVEWRKYMQPRFKQTHKQSVQYPNALQTHNRK